MQIRAIDMQPYRPWPLRLMNGYGRWLNRLGIEPVKLDSDHLIAEAVKRAGSSDFGDEGYRAGLDRLVAALNTDARLNLLGRLMAREEIVHRLATRLCVLAWRHQHPEVADEKVHTPLFIVGLPRTGTTILHALLALDPAHRSPLFWEVEQPVPPSTPASWAIDPRIDQVKRKLALFNKLCPGIQAVHVMEAELQQECVAILAMDLRAEQFFTLYDVPGYAEWLIDEPRAWALHFHRQMLQHLQSGGVRCSRWLLKSPCHLHRLNELLVEYPDAHIIHTHRDPIEVCSSMASMTAMLRGVGSDAIDLALIGRQQIDLWSEMLARAVCTRRELAAQERDACFFDLQMQETVADPLGAVERIYDHFGYKLRPSVKADMERFIKNNPRDKHGSHRYTAADFGIDRSRDAARFGDYCAYFGIPSGV